MLITRFHFFVRCQFDHEGILSSNPRGFQTTEAAENSLLPKATVVAEEDAKSGFHGTVEKAWILKDQTGKRK